MSASDEREQHLPLHFARHGGFGPVGTELVVLERGAGAQVSDTSGRRHLDRPSTRFCAQLGHSFGAEMAAVAAPEAASDHMGVATS